MDSLTLPSLADLCFQCDSPFRESTMIFLNNIVSPENYALLPVASGLASLAHSVCSVSVP